jgi:aspartyl/glutamyl-tRNA(Asn/Gln) amidotransferase C subunit
MKNKEKIISNSDVKHIAKLSKLKIKKVEFEKFQKQLSNIFKYVNQVAKMNTNKVTETSQVTGLENQFREDKIIKNRILTQKQALSNGKKLHQGYFVVKSVFDN